jgi:hypothetical protein
MGGDDLGNLNETCKTLLKAVNMKAAICWDLSVYSEINFADSICRLEECVEDGGSTFLRNNQ